MKISVIIPMYNEAKIIANTANTLSSYLRERFDSYELIFSDDGSTDGCGDIVRNLNLPCVRVTGYTQNRGKGCAIRTAMLEATGELILFTDADLAYGTEKIGEVYDFYREQSKLQDVHMILGSRNLRADGYDGYSVLRKVMSKLYIRILCLVGGFRLSDSQCGFKAFRQDVARDLFERMTVDGFAFDFEAILWAQELGYRILEFPVQVIYHRDSKIRIFRDSFRMLRDLIRIRKQVKKAAKAKKQ